MKLYVMLSSSNLEESTPLSSILHPLHIHAGFQNQNDEDTIIYENNYRLNRL